MSGVRNIIVVAAILFGLLAGCTPTEGLPTERPSTGRPSREWPGPSKLPYPTLDRCAAEGGTVQASGGLLPGQMCVVRTPDAGKICADSDQCIGRCLYQDEKPGVQGRPGARVTGQCEPSNATFGCFAEVRNGRLTGALCVD